MPNSIFTGFWDILFRQACYCIRTTHVMVMRVTLTLSSYLPKKGVLAEVIEAAKNHSFLPLNLFNQLTFMHNIVTDFRVQFSYKLSIEPLIVWFATYQTILGAFTRSLGGSNGHAFLTTYYCLEVSYMIKFSCNS
ncbi:unnamed protein product [Musa textilis]